MGTGSAGKRDLRELVDIQGLYPSGSRMRHPDVPAKGPSGLHG